MRKAEENFKTLFVEPFKTGGGGVLPYKGLMGTCGRPGYVFRDFCLLQGLEYIIFCLNRGIDLIVFVSLKQDIFSWTINSKFFTSSCQLILTSFRVKCLKPGIKNRNSVLNRVGKSAIFALNRVRV